MAATLALDTLTSAGSGITVATGKTLTVGGKSITAGSTNIQRATGDVTVATTADYDVAGKSELVIAANASAATRTITLCPVTETGVDTCIITVVADADATSTYKLTVVESDGSTEVWTGYQKGDFVRLIVSNSAWAVIDHKETYFSHRYLTADQDIAATAGAKLTGFTSVSDIGGFWDNANNKLVSPFAGFCDLRFALSNYVSPTDSTHSLVPQLYVDGAAYWLPASTGGDAVGYHKGTFTFSLRLKLAASKDIEFYAHNLQSGAVYGGTARSGATRTQFTCSFERTY